MSKLYSKSVAATFLAIVALFIYGCASPVPKGGMGELNFSQDFDKLVKIRPVGSTSAQSAKKHGRTSKKQNLPSHQAAESVWMLRKLWHPPLLWPLTRWERLWHPPLVWPPQPRKPDELAVWKQRPHSKRLMKAVVESGKKHGLKRSHTMPGERLPLVEDSEDMIGRRPKFDPFHVGERITMDVSYFNVVAGTLELETLPFVDVNGHKAYHFRYVAKSSPLFSLFYSVDDVAETFLDYTNLLPSTYQLHVRESKQAKEVRAFWDFQKGEAHVWDKTITSEHGLTEKNQKWKLEPYAQNVFSAAFYVRIFQMYPGKKLSFYVADGGHNYLFTGEVIKRDKLKTKAGTFNAVVLKPKLKLNGIFHPVGNVLLWFSDDPHHYLLRIESKIKIGKIICQIAKLKP